MSKDVPGSAPLRVALVTGNLNLGGASSLLLNLTGELNRRGIQTLVFSFEKENPLASDFKADGVEVVFEDEDKSIFEDRLSACLELLAEFRPACVVAWLAPPSFEVLRYVPSGILRVGLDVSDKACIYPTDYAPFMDVLVGVSEKIAATARSLPAFGRVDVRCIHCGVPIPEPRQRISDFSPPRCGLSILAVCIKSQKGFDCFQPSCGISAKARFRFPGPLWVTGRSLIFSRRTCRPAVRINRFISQARCPPPRCRLCCPIMMSSFSLRTSKDCP